MQSAGETTIHDLLDPFTRERRDLRFETWSGAAGHQPGPARDVDGSDWWVMPAVIDADAHMPFIPAGLRRYDLLAALHGGVHHMVVALPFQLARRHPLPALISELSGQVLPAITPVVSVLPDEQTADFPAWLAENVELIGETLASVVKLYTPDPAFRANLEAVWDAGLTPAVFAYTPQDLDMVLSFAHAPLHVRHVTSRAMLDAVHEVSGATFQTSPHLVLDLEPGRRQALTVMPTPPEDSDRRSLQQVVGQVHLLASDHVSPPLGASAGPGLQTQQHFVPALLTMADNLELDLDPLWRQVTSAPASVFGLDTLPGSIVVDPAEQPATELWPRQREDRAPYLGSSLRGRVLAVTRGEHAVMV